jgi:hypothetical protein
MSQLCLLYWECPVPGQVGGEGELTGLVPAEHVQVVKLRNGRAVPSTRRNLQQQ